MISLGTRLMVKHKSRFCALCSYPLSYGAKRTFQASASSDIDEQQWKPRQNRKSNWVHPYQDLYPWQSLTDFVNHLEKNIIYEDDRILVLDKPWGVGTHRSNPTITKKTNYQLFSEAFGNPKFCIDDALGPLSEKLKIKDELYVGKAIDRYQSGVMILTKNKDAVTDLKKTGSRMQNLNRPFMTFWCICKGWPANISALEERVGVKLSEIDEFGDYKEPEILMNYSKNSVKLKDVKPALVHMKVLQTNRELSVSLLEIKTTFTKWNFVQCYAAMKTTFVLGDVRFAKRVRHLLGVPILLSPHNINAYDTFEPLPSRIRTKLLVPKNSSIPLMLHLKSFAIPIKSKGKLSELVLDTNNLPPHFEWSMKKLNLLDHVSQQVSKDRQN